MESLINSELWVKNEERAHLASVSSGGYGSLPVVHHFLAFLHHLIV
ncbi:unnamed protein product [Onchocerca flexuosa]|uniref:Uncharacterized protein n=1 Tax=Onchocerca flexuosa TaxID=387005 RepID=A0A183HDF6_9BILA|nr:unnamed protein product [Onchocerca flexuosa]